MKKVTNDWKSQLSIISSQMYQEMSQEDREKAQNDKEEEMRKQYEFQLRQNKLWDFLTGYKQNSGIFINNFFRKRDFETYCKDKFEEFEFLIGELIPNVFDDFNLSMTMISYLDKLDKMKIAYYPVDKDYMEHLIAFAECMDLLPTIDSETILYRGCSTIERNGVNGIVSTTTDYKIAEQFSRGTILKIHVPAGTKNINVKSIRPLEQQNKDCENEILLPPCEYEIISEEEIKRGHEPNNRSLTTRILEIKVKPLDLLDEFLKVMEDPHKEFEDVRIHMAGRYEEAYEMLKRYLETRKKGQKTLGLK